ncbi:hypothetical protein D3C72_143260 [compost metagenome]
MYALFAWETGQQKGGIGDLLVMGSVDECQKTFLSFVSALSTPAIGEIIDMYTLKIVLRASLIASKDARLPDWIAPSGWLIEWVKPQAASK